MKKATQLFPILLSFLILGGCATARTGLGDDRPRIVAHRGFAHVAPENTLVAYQKAIDVGATLAECDVHLSADGALVLMHDTSLERTTGVKRDVGDLTLAELRELEASRWFCGSFEDEPIPTLEEALDLVRGHLRFIIELKGKHTAKPVVDLLSEKGVRPEEVIIFSFQREEVAEAIRLNPELYGAYLIHEAPQEPEKRAEELDFAQNSDCSGVGLKHTRVDADFLAMARARGLDVFVYTMNEEAEIRAMITLGVDGVITDRPDLAQKILEEMRAESP
jgi:glycerophosphoryl diester phosphodiesterase